MFDPIINSSNAWVDFFSKGAVGEFISVLEDLASWIKAVDALAGVSSTIREAQV